VAERLLPSDHSRTREFGPWGLLTTASSRATLTGEGSHILRREMGVSTEAGTVAPRALSRMPNLRRLPGAPRI
jgi:hypothetical protein